MADDSEILKQLDSVLDDSMTQAQRFLAMWRVAQTTMPLPEAKIVAPAFIITMQSTDPALMARIEAWQTEGLAIGKLLDQAP